MVVVVRWRPSRVQHSRASASRQTCFLAVRWYLRYGLSYRDVEELLAERGIDGDHVTLYRRVRHFTPLLADVAVAARHAVGVRWFVDETYVKVAVSDVTSTALSTNTAK